MNSAIWFQFEDQQSAGFAFDTLQELGYEPTIHPGEQKPTLHIHVDRSDLTSALEIAQAHGGVLIEQSDIEDGEAFNQAYRLDEVNIPAHVVNEDWPEWYAGHDAEAGVSAGSDYHDSGATSSIGAVSIDANDSP